HLPVGAGHVRGDEGRGAGRFAGLVLELIRLPGDTVVAALDDDFRARMGHGGEETVAVEASKWGGFFVGVLDKLGPSDAAIEAVYGRDDGENDHGQRGGGQQHSGPS